MKEEAAAMRLSIPCVASRILLVSLGGQPADLLKQTEEQCFKFHSTLRRSVHQVQAVLLASSATRSVLRSFSVRWSTPLKCLPSDSLWNPRGSFFPHRLACVTLVLQANFFPPRVVRWKLLPPGRAARARGRSVRRSVNRRAALNTRTPDADAGQRAQDTNAAIAHKTQVFEPFTRRAWQH